jgi:Uncharacterized protein conserved in bacteria
MNLDLTAKTNLALLQSFNRDIYSSGSVSLTAGVRGTLSKPLVNGQLQLQNASINHVDLPNGLQNANGLVVFSGNTATIRNLTAESGGGKVASPDLLPIAIRCASACALVPRAFASAPSRASAWLPTAFSISPELQPPAWPPAPSPLRASPMRRRATSAPSSPAPRPRPGPHRAQCRTG